MFVVGRGAVLLRPWALTALGKRRPVLPGTADADLEDGCCREEGVSTLSGPPLPPRPLTAEVRYKPEDSHTL